MNKKAESFISAFRIVLILVALIWIVEIINITLNHTLTVYGILPRNTDTLSGIILHPFLHGNLQHTILNTVPLLVLGTFVAIEGKRVFIKSTLGIILIGGGLLWILGRPAYHIGASLLVFGYFGFIITNAFYKKSAFSILAAFITVFLYGGIIYGIIPSNSYVSWEGHLFGLASGMLMVRTTAKPVIPGK